jgi:allantoicase
MDGWESRRKRQPGHDYCIVRLGVPGVIHGIDIDTRYFTGNFPPSASVDACECDADVPDDATTWQEILPAVELQGDAHHFHEITDKRQYSHLRLHIYPDGGVARLRIFGEITPAWVQVSGDDIVDLFALQNGGRALLCSDEHFGSMHNLNLPGRGINMGDGWETARRRGPGHDWVILALGHAGTVTHVEIDTAHFKGNYPDSGSLQAALLEDADYATLGEDSNSWPELLPPQKLGMDREHQFRDELRKLGPVSHLRLCMFPDGGISRLRVFGRVHR